ncbi:MAG: hypothetical protein A2538_01805 [Candidatus Magasanikbacteria bacterium RIFOXYD2_FULL_41_14]|uniref:Uncharacterized protein n=1 Tax=Candidatus Magasanikbacteria bacterium RIFOXYD2_FULL_41_14 TaxID=1798709 RepID=A0A1F6PDP5_9BACT|nr:MAG: hypothetical protein A2538_01805 [Candidatus Magasanikbacteria bacterium RIFOXYD2_FULL_41_14]
MVKNWLCISLSRNVEKIGNAERLGRFAATNRRLAGQKVSWLWKKPYDILVDRTACPVLLTTLNEVRKFYENGGNMV